MLCAHVNVCALVKKYNGQWKFSLLLGSSTTEGNSMIFKLTNIPVLQWGGKLCGQSAFVWWRGVSCGPGEAAVEWELLVAPLPLGIAQPSW